MTTIAMNPKDFYASLVDELAARRNAQSEVERNFGGDRPMAADELVEWLQFQCWYEREAANFIGSWLADTPEQEAFFGLCQQIADEARHCKLVLSHLQTFGATMDGWVPEREWVEWVQVFYANGADTLERVCAHNITGEIGVMNAFEGLRPRIPEATRQLIDKIVPDEEFHIALGRMLVHRYATTADRQERVRQRVWGAFALEEKGRLAFDRRLRSLAA